MNKDVLMENAIAYALKQGADTCEIYAVSAATDRTVVRDAKLYDHNLADTHSFSLRLIKNGVVGFSYGSVLEREALRMAADSALLSCGFLSADPHYSFVPAGKEYPFLPQKEKSVVSLAEKKEFLFAMEERALGEKQIQKTDKSSLSEAVTSIKLKNSLGLDLSFGTSYWSCALAAVAEKNGEIQTGGDYCMAKNFRDLSGISVAKTAAENACGKLNAITVKSGEYPVILCQEAVLDLLSLILPAFLGDTIRKGQSRLEGKLGETIAHPEFFLYDDGIYAEGIASCPFDDQGTPTQKTPLMEQGVVCSFLYDISAASKVGVVSTGNGYTSSTKSLPTTGFGNYYLLGGTTPKDALFASVERGLYIKDFMGLHMADSVSGDFSLGIGGFLIEQGECTKSVRGNMAAGNIFMLFKEIEAIGNDFRFYGYKGAPRIKLKSLKISGKTC